jgi:hypothetical protein
MSVPANCDFSEIDEKSKEDLIKELDALDAVAVGGGGGGDGKPASATSSSSTTDAASAAAGSGGGGDPRRHPRRNHRKPNSRSNSGGENGELADGAANGHLQPRLELKYSKNSRRSRTGYGRGLPKKGKAFLD